MNDLKNLNLPQLLDRMADITVPEPVSWWPQTFGWVVLGLVLLTAVAYATWRLARGYRGRRYRRQALLELDVLKADERGADLSRVAEILRRVALVSFPRVEVAALFGEDWLEFLERTGDGIRFSDSVGRHLVSVPYTKPDQVPLGQRRAVVDLARRWVIQHNRFSHA